MQTIHKFTLDPTEYGGKQILDIPENAKIIKVDDQGGRICIWAIVDDEAPTRHTFFYTLGTGQKMPADIDEFEYLDSVLQYVKGIVGDPETKELMPVMKCFVTHVFVKLKQ